MQGGPEFRTYHFYPFWGPERKIVHIRLDPPNTGPFELQSIQIVESAHQDITAGNAWDFRDPQTRLPSADTAAPLKRTPQGLTLTTTAGRLPVTYYTDIDAQGSEFVVVRMASSRSGTGRLSYALDGTLGLQSYSFPVRGEGRPHVYNLEPGARRPWKGRIVFLALDPLVEPGAEVTVESIRLAPEPQGPADVEIRFFGATDTLPRAGRPVALSCNLVNHGGPLQGRFTAGLKVPEGVTIVGPAAQELPPMPFSLPRTLAWQVTAKLPVEGEARVEITGGEERLVATCPLRFAASLGLSKADYVPEPRPVDTGPYQVGVYYFPGWQNASRWLPIQGWPNRRPALGWYDEGSPEVADWQIKWMLEHGVTWIAYDWYWCKGARHLEHGLHDALFKARYQDRIKFCLLYANHNPPGTTSVDDSLELTRYWIENYFRRPNYLQVEGRPVVIIFSPHRITSDMGHANVRPMFEKMDALCREHGIPGIYMVACARGDRRTVEELTEEGYSALSGYNYPGIDVGPSHEQPFSRLAAGTEGVWSKVADAGLIKEIPALSGGWDPRPWHGPDPRRYYPDRTPGAFLAHCRAARQFLDTRGKAPHLCIIEAWNEWGEGSYIEPHAEYGFGYLDAVREVFAPGAGSHVDLTPADVGLGPYDVPPVELRTEWSFDAPGDTQQWSAAMGLSDLRAEGGSLQFRTTSHDPALHSPPLQVEAAQFTALAIRIKAGRDDTAQLFWATTSSPVSEPNSVRFPVHGDGEFHDCRVDLAENRRWRGIVTHLRLDPGNQAGAEFEIDSIRLVPR